MQIKYTEPPPHQERGGSLEANTGTLLDCGGLKRAKSYLAEFCSMPTNMPKPLTPHSKFLRSQLVFTRESLQGKPVSRRQTRQRSEPTHRGVMAGEARQLSWPQPLANFLRTRVAQAFLSLIMFISFIAAVVVFVPRLYYTLTPVDTVPLESLEKGTPLGGDFAAGTGTNSGTTTGRRTFTYVPPFDETLPEGEWLIIPRIGVRAQLYETASPEEALAKGVWKVPQYGEAGDLAQPLILVAHRFGWKWWYQSDYWKYNSFYYLDKTEPGDRIEVIANQRKWVYEIYAGEEGEEITDYSADMILYTCKFLDSPIRYFRYARLIDPTADSQGVES